MAHEAPHIQTAFDRDLEALQALIMKMGGLVESAMAGAARALEARDEELAEQVRAADAQVDLLERQIHQDCARIIALRGPTATDLRTVLSVMKTAGDLERIGDYAKNIAKRVAVLAQLPQVGNSAGTLRRMMRAVELMLKDALDAFTHPPLDRVEIDCDLKLPGREPELVDALRERGLLERAMVSTMYVGSLARIAALEPRLRIGWTYPLVTRAWDRSAVARPAVAAVLGLMRRRFPAEARRRAPEIGAHAIWAFHRIATPRLARVAADLGIELIAWTVDDATAVARLREIGVTGVCSNDPRLLQ